MSESQGFDFNVQAVFVYEEMKDAMPEIGISVPDFLKETWEDFNSPTTSNFVSKLNQCRATVTALEETLDYDRSGLIKMKKAVKAVCSSGQISVSSDNYLVEILEKMGGSTQKESEGELNAAFSKFSIIIRELSNLMKGLMQSMNNIILFPLDSFLQHDVTGVRGDLKKPFDKAWKDYENRFNKIVKEKKQLARDAGMIKTEVTGAEVADEMERERQALQLQMCEYLIKANEIKTKKGVDLLQHFVDFYQAQTNYFQDGLKAIENFRSYLDGIVPHIESLKQKQGNERRKLVELRDSLKERMSSYKETTPAPSGYSLHQLQGNKIHGHERNGFLLKKSEGKIKKVWQKRRCTIKEGILSISHSDMNKDPVQLNLLTCQVKPVHDDPGKKCFDLISSSKNRTYHFQADDSAEMEEWISVLNNAKELVLMKAFGEPSAASTEPYNRSIRELTGRLIQDIKGLAGNQKCCDCGAPAPEWLSVNLGVLICLECCGIHRDMGVHISRTQSIVIDELNVAQLLVALVMTNEQFNEIMEATLGPGSKLTQRSSMEEKKMIIRNKYEKRHYCLVTSPDLDARRDDLKQAILAKDPYAVLQVFAEGIDFMEPLPQTERGENSLHLAIITENDLLYSLVIVDFIIQNTNSQELCRRTKDGNTALHFCALFNRTESMKLVLRSRPDLVTCTNNDGDTPMDIALARRHDFCVDLLKHALDGKAEMFGNLNIHWEFRMDEATTLDCSDDELEPSPPQQKLRPRPPSLVFPSELSFHGSGLSLHDRSLTTDNFKVHHPFGVAASTGRSKLPSTSDILSSSAGQMSPSAAGLVLGRDLAARKKQAPPPPHRGHIRNPSDPGFAQKLSQARSPNDPPPPLPQKVGRVRLPGAELVLPQRPAQHSLKPTPNPRHSRLIAPAKLSGEVNSSDPPPPPLPLKPKLFPVDIGEHKATSNNNNSQNVPSRVPPVSDSKAQISNVSQKKRCVASFKCTADNEDELSFEAGEVIIVLNSEEDEWWEGEIEGDPKRKGMFPVVFVRLLDKKET